MGWNPGQTISEEATKVYNNVKKGDLNPINTAGTNGGVAGAAAQTGGDISKGVQSWGTNLNAHHAAETAGSDISNAYKTSVVNPVNDLVQGYHDALDRITAPKSMPNISVPNVSSVGGVGAGGFGGAAGSVGANGAGGFGKVSVGAAPNDVFRQQQTQLMSQLAAQANGTGPSLAAQQLQQGQQQNLAATMAQLASQRGQANPLAQKQAFQTMADSNAQTNQAAAVARMQEQQQAQGLLGQLTSAGRSGDLASQQLGMSAQIANNDVAAKQASLALQYQQMGLDAQKANQQAALDIAKLQSQNTLGLGALQMQSGVAQNALIGNALGAAGTVAAAMSDKRLKTDVKPGDKKLEQFLLAAGAHDYKYKDEKFGKGRRISPMAQEIESTSLGKAFVKETPEGKMVDYGKALGTMLSAQGMLMRRLKELEGKK